MLADTTVETIHVDLKRDAPKAVRVSLLVLQGMLGGISAFGATFALTSGDQYLALVFAISFVLYSVPFVGTLLRKRWAYFVALGVGCLAILGSLGGSAVGIGIAAAQVTLSLKAVIATSSKSQAVQ